ncbi:general substrate transporter [Lipomyces doorenjongii]
MDPIEDKYGGVFIWLLTCSAAVGGLLFGYDLIVISGILVMVKDDLGETLTSNKQELLTSIASGGAFIGALIAGVLLDRVGRKIVIGLGALVFTVGSIIQATSFSLAQLTVGRFVVGLGIGEAAMVAPIYIAEISPAKIRGRLVTVDSLAITGGECIANALNIAFEHVSHGWRYSVGLAAVPSLLTWAGIVVLVCVILFIATNALALGNVPWQGNELFPMEVRSLGTMMLTLTCWGSNIVVSSTYLSMMKKFTPTGAFGFYAGLTFVGWIAIVLCYPEVSGLTLEEIKDVFRHGFGVRYSVRMQKDRKLAVKEKKVLRHELSS